MGKLGTFREQFPHTKQTIYLDHAATGPLSIPVRKAIDRFLEQRHRTKPNNFFDLFRIIERGRLRIAKLLGCPVECVEYAPNTSSGLNILAMGYPWKSGDRIAVPSCEFPANVQPWLGLRERFGVEVDFIPTTNGCFTLDDVETTIRPETRLLSVSWVQFVSGYGCDLAALAELAHANDVLFAVDAIQGLGALEMDIEELGIDFLASGGQKWLLSTQGSAFTYVNDALRDKLIPMRGWLSGPVDWEDFGSFGDDLHPDATRFRTGTLNSIGCVALDAALKLYFDTGPELIEATILENARLLTQGLRDMGFRRFGSSDPRHASGIATFEATDPEGLDEALKNRNIQASVRNRKIRFSPHAYTSEEEIETVLEVCSTFATNHTM